MASLLLAVIYLSFVSLGLPDSVLGSAWPVMHTQFSVPVSYAGIVTMIIAGGTIVSSLLSDRLTKKLGAGLVTALSVALTACALFGFSFSRSFAVICAWAVPYGLGAGAVDAALNNYVALHYSSRHMNWLHGCWGIGASVSPYIMSYALSGNSGWSGGYRIIGLMQAVLTFIILFSLPLWKKRDVPEKSEEKKEKKKNIFAIKGVVYILIAFFCYCSLETTSGLWASSYLVGARGLDVVSAARFASLFYIGIMICRFLSGIFADRLGDRTLIRTGCLVMIVGMLLMIVPSGIKVLPLAGLVITGMGCAPVYPSIIHSTPANFGKENSQAIIGVQMASAYTGSTFMPPVFGLIAQHINIALFPYFLLFFAVLLVIMTECLNKIKNTEKTK